MIRHPGVVLALSLLVSVPALAAGPITPEEAIKEVGKPEVVIRMRVANAKDRTAKRGIVYLDSSPDFKDPKNLGVAISAGAAEKIKAQGVADLEAHFKGKTIEVRGCVMRFEERPYLPVLDPGLIRIVETR